MKTAALIVSAGYTPLRSGFDPLQKLGSISVAQRQVATFSLAGIKPVAMMVTEQKRKEVEKDVAHLGTIFLSGQDDAEMFDNIRSGLRFLMDRCDQVLITPVDVPLFTAETVQALLAAHSKVAAPVCDGEQGHPLLLQSELIPWILAYDGTDGLRGAVRRNICSPTPVTVSDRGVLLKASPTAGREEALRRHTLNRYHPVLSVGLAKETAFLGADVMRLLGILEHTTSVQEACSQMGISYSKAWKLLNSLEKQLNYAVITRQHGGKHGGGACLTAEGLALLQWFSNFEEECRLAVQEVFARHRTELPGAEEHAQKGT